MPSAVQERLENRDGGLSIYLRLRTPAVRVLLAAPGQCFGRREALINEMQLTAEFSGQRGAQLTGADSRVAFTAILVQWQTDHQAGQLALTHCVEEAGRKCLTRFGGYYRERQGQRCAGIGDGQSATHCAGIKAEPLSVYLTGG